MGPGDGSPALAEASLSAGLTADAPFQRPGLRVRALPFAVVAVVAEASMVLPPGPQSWPMFLVSLGLLLAVAAAFWLPWARLPAWSPVFVPLVYTGSVLALILASGTTSGVGVVVLAPLIWTALFHRPWESACVVAAIVAVEVIISLTPVIVPDDVTLRRVVLWALLGALISVATHGLRARLRRAREHSGLMEQRLRELTVAADRDRIAADLRDKVIQRIFAAGLTVQSAAALATQQEVRHRLDGAVDELDQAVQTLRNTVFALDHRLQGHGVRQDVLALCAELSPVPEISFSGPVDGALHPSSRVRLLEMLRGFLDVTGRCGPPARISIAADAGFCHTVIEGGPALDDGAGGGQELAMLMEHAAETGVSIDVQPSAGGTRFAWRVPLQ